MKHILLSLLFLSILFFISRYIFEPTYLYYEFPWLDIPMHVLGGVGIALLTGSFLKYKGYPVSLWKLLTVYTLIAIMWEMYEYLRGVMVYEDIYKWLDSAKDYINGAVGVIGVYLIKRK